MSYTYSLIIELRRRGLSYREISKTLHVSQATVARVLKRKASRKNAVARKTQEGVFETQRFSGMESAFQPSLIFDRSSFPGFGEAELISWLEEEVKRLHEALAREQAIAYEMSQRVKELEQALPELRKRLGAESELEALKLAALELWKSG